MLNLLVEDIQEASLARLETRASVHGLSLQQEVKAILAEAVAEADREALRGWGMELPCPVEAADPDSVDQLERYLCGEEATVQDWINHCLPWDAPQD